jgi:hypothetical protein
MKKVAQVLSTSDYSLFKRQAGNRVINAGHVKRLTESIKQQDLMIPIIVNNKMEVIDGQHRLEARTRLKAPVYYLVVDGYGLAETQRVNANNKNWNIADFVDGYVEMNYYHYKVYKQFRNRYQFGHQESMMLLSGLKQGDGNGWKEFQSGGFCVVDLDKANDVAEKIYAIEPYYAGYKRRSFVMAILHCFKHDEYNHEEFIQKLAYQSSKLVHCVTIVQYLKIIDEIYNYKRKPEDKIRFV